MRIAGILKWSLILLIFVGLAWVLGYGGAGQAATGIAKVLFWVFAVLFLLSLFFGSRIAR
jgi:uncharacterized membrane protein YtjA (UPF0391 family)